MSRIVLAIAALASLVNFCAAQTPFTVYNAGIAPLEFWIKVTSASDWQRHYFIQPKKEHTVTLLRKAPYDICLREWSPDGTQLIDTRGDRLPLYTLANGLAGGTGIRQEKLKTVQTLELQNGRWVRLPHVQPAAEHAPYNMQFSAVGGKVYLEFPPQGCPTADASETPQPEIEHDGRDKPRIPPRKK